MTSTPGSTLIRHRPHPQRARANNSPITLDTNRYSVPIRYAGVRVTIKAYPDRVCIYHQDQLIARHTRSYDRH